MPLRGTRILAVAALVAAGSLWTAPPAHADPALAGVEVKQHGHALLTDAGRRG